MSSDKKQPNLPEYRSHKKVKAVKIESILPIPLEESEALPIGEIMGDILYATITPENKDIQPFAVSVGYVLKHKPQAGGYYVRYEDGYESWSPAEAFESGYTLISE